MLQWWSLLWAELPQSLAPMAEVKFAYSVCGHAGCYVTFAVFVLLIPLQISTDVFCILTLLVLLNNSELALLLFPPLYQNKCEGENPCCLGSVSLFMNQRMLDHNYPCTITYNGAKSRKAGCYLPFFSQSAVFVLTHSAGILEVQACGSSLFLQQFCIRVLFLKLEMGFPSCSLGTRALCHYSQPAQ